MFIIVMETEGGGEGAVIRSLLEREIARELAVVLIIEIYPVILRAHCDYILCAREPGEVPTVDVPRVPSDTLTVFRPTAQGAVNGRRHNVVVRDCDI